MSNYKIIVDSACEVNNLDEIFENTEMIPFTIDVDDKNFIDNGTVNIEDFINIMNDTPNPVKTAAPSPMLFLDALDGKKNNFIITISSRLSATYGNAVLAGKMLKEKFDNAEVNIIDSKAACAGEVVIYIKLKNLIEKGLGFNEIVESINKFVKEQKTFCVLEKLDHLVKNGRMSKLKGKIASFLYITPILIAIDGELESYENVRGIKRSIKTLVRIIGENCTDFNKDIVITHCNNLERANEVKELIKEKYNFNKIYVVANNALGSVYANQSGIVVSF